MAGTGAPKTGGRPKGALNKRTRDLMAKCEARGIDVFDALLDYVVIPSTVELRFQALKELAQYLYPKRKAVEHSGEINSAYADLPLEQLEQMVREKLMSIPQVNPNPVPLTSMDNWMPKDDSDD